jgi:hypothetical protein
VVSTDLRQQALSALSRRFGAPIVVPDLFRHSIPFFLFVFIISVHPCPALIFFIEQDSVHGVSFVKHIARAFGTGKREKKNNFFPASDTASRFFVVALSIEKKQTTAALFISNFAAYSPRTSRGCSCIASERA